jgi:hypothetical protein
MVTTYSIIPSIRCRHIVLQIAIEDPPGPGGRAGSISHWGTIYVMEIGDVGKLVPQGAGVGCDDGGSLDISVDNYEQ